MEVAQLLPTARMSTFNFFQEALKSLAREARAKLAQDDIYKQIHFLVYILCCLKIMIFQAARIPFGRHTKTSVLITRWSEAPPA